MSSLALAFSASLLMTQRSFTKVFVSGITDVIQNSREMTYFGADLDLASQRNVYCYVLLCNNTIFIFSSELHKY